METTTRTRKAFKRADAALYEAKQAGRNRVVRRRRCVILSGA